MKMKLLDIGCGPGTISNLGYYNKFRKGYTIYGVDFLKENIKTIKKRVPYGFFKVGDAEKLSFSNSEFDYILLRHVLEHVVNLNKVLKEINRVSKSGAILHIAVPHHRLEHILNKTIPHYVESGHHHQRIFSEKELEKRLKKEGYEIIQTSNDKWPMFCIVFLFAQISRFSKKISMEEQSGVFMYDKKNYLHNKKLYPLYILIYNFLDISNHIFFFLNKLIPFETEIVARKK